MKGLEVYVSTDYSTGPGPRVVLNIDCDEFDLSCNNKESITENEFINTLKEKEVLWIL